MKNYWLFFVLKRFNSAGKVRSTFIVNLFPVLGICFGVMVLIVVLSVMNGFQRGYIDTVIEVSSSHVRLEGKIEDLKKLEEITSYKSFVVFSEEQVLLQGKNGREGVALIRSVESNILKKDVGFKEKIKMVQGEFDLGETQKRIIKIVLGDELAKQLSLKVADTVRVLATSGSSCSDLFPEDVELFVSGLFKTGYYEIDSNFAFIDLSLSSKLFGERNSYFANVKLENEDEDVLYVSNIKKNKNEVNSKTWREYNRAFFGALKIEKNVMMLLVVLIFLVVAVNIYNGMRRSIYEKREDISTLMALGATNRSIKGLFVISGFLIGMFGSLLGLFLGLFVSIHINDVFSIIEMVVNGTIHIFSLFLEDRLSDDFAIFNTTYFYMEKVPIKMFFNEIFFVFLFGLASSTFAAVIATKKVMEIKLAEILRYE